MPIPQGPLTEAEEELGEVDVEFEPCSVCGQAVPVQWHMDQHTFDAITKLNFQRRLKTRKQLIRQWNEKRIGPCKKARVKDVNNKGVKE